MWLTVRHMARPHRCLIRRASLRLCTTRGWHKTERRTGWRTGRRWVGGAEVHGEAAAVSLTRLLPYMRLIITSHSYYSSVWGASEGVYHTPTSVASYFHHIQTLETLKIATTSSPNSPLALCVCGGRLGGWEAAAAITAPSCSTSACPPSTCSTGRVRGTH